MFVDTTIDPTDYLGGNFGIFTLKKMFKIKKRNGIAQKKWTKIKMSNFQKWKEKFAKK
jgi:hypothetical protein